MRVDVSPQAANVVCHRHDDARASAETRHVSLSRNVSYDFNEAGIRKKKITIHAYNSVIIAEPKNEWTSSRFALVINSLCSHVTLT